MGSADMPSAEFGTVGLLVRALTKAATAIFIAKLLVKLLSWGLTV